MLNPENPILWLGGVTVVTAAVLFARRYLSTEARETRRRARSHGRVVSKAKRPLVKLAVETKKPESNP